MLSKTGIKGVQTGISAEGIKAVRIHYSADPDKDPSNPVGAAWLKKELQGYRGETDPRWRKEMMIDFDAHGGQLLFPYMLGNQDQLFIKPHSVEGLQLIAGLDYGTRNPSAFEVLAINYDNDINIAYEYYEAPKKSNETDDDFRKRKGHKVLCAAIKQCPYFQGLTILADPSLWNKTQESADSKGLMSIADLFLQEGVKLSPGQRGRDFACYEHIDKNLWKEPAKPKLTISQTCPWLWWEMQRLRFSDYSATTQVNQNLQEKIVDKDNHAWDAVKYAMSNIIRVSFFTDIVCQDFPQ
jgi:hypothetical protein